MHPPHAGGHIRRGAGSVLATKRPAHDERRAERDAGDADPIVRKRADRSRDVRPMAVLVGALAFRTRPSAAAPQAATFPVRSSCVASIPVSTIPTGTPPTPGNAPSPAARQAAGAPIAAMP
jgi:hypothetical protein